MRATNGQRPRPAQAFVAHAERDDVTKRLTGMTNRVRGLAARDGYESFHGADHRLDLRVLAVPCIVRRCQQSLSALGVAAQRQQPALIASEVMYIRQSIGICGQAEGT